MNAKIKIVIVLVLFSFFFIPNVTSIGLSPPQLRITNAPMGENMKVASIVVTNTGTEPNYILFQIGCLAKTRDHKLRVVCNGCSRDVGIQRGDLIDGACPFCGSRDLIIYDFTPNEILDNITLGCLSHPLERRGNRQYYTVDEVQPSESVEVNIYVNIPDSKSYYNKYWEARIMATSVDNVEGTDEFIIYGVEAKFLIDTQTWQEVRTEEGTNYIFVALGIVGAVCGAIILIIIIFFIKVRRKAVPLTFPEKADISRGKIIKSIKGRKLL